MMPRADSKENKSLRTFFFYFGIVFFFVVISLGIKAFTLLQESRFDREHQFILFLAEGEIVKQIAIFTPVDRKVSVVTLQGVKVTQSTAPRILGVLPDGFVSTKFPLNDLNIPEIIQKIGFSFIATVKLQAQSDNQIQVYFLPTIGEGRTIIKLHNNYAFTGSKRLLYPKDAPGKIILWGITHGLAKT